MKWLQHKWNTLKQLVHIYGGKLLQAIVFSIFRLLPYRKNRIVFSSFCGKSYSCNPRAIYEYLTQHYPGRFRYVWLWDYASDPEIPRDKLKGVRFAPVDSFRSSYYKATSGVWIFNHRNTSYFYKKKGQFYIQTWHGDIGFKGFDARSIPRENYDTPYVRKCFRDSAMLDALIVGSEWGYQNMKAAFFWPQGTYWKCGYPRTDILFHPQCSNAREEVRRRYGLDKDVHICLYAPTFRPGFRLTASLMRNGEQGVEQILRAHEKRFGGKWVLMFRVHPALLAEEKKRSFNFGPRVVDASAYGDMMDLLVACDTLISDYSSTPYEIALAGKPCWLLFDDWAQFRRSVTIVLDETQVLLDKCPDLPALCSAIESFDEARYHENVRQMLRILGSYETGEASAFVAQKLVDYLEN